MKSRIVYIEHARIQAFLKTLAEACNIYPAPSLRPLTAELVLEYWEKLATQLFPSPTSKCNFSSGVWTQTRKFNFLFGYPHVLINEILRVSFWCCLILIIKEIGLREM